MARTPLFRFLQSAGKKEASAKLVNGPTDGTPLLRASLSRREFLSHAGLAGLGLWGTKALGGSLFSPNWLAKTGPAAPQIAILGAGVAGLTAAYQLMKAGLRPVIYEGSSRVGGRIRTFANFNSEKMFCELGGELIDSGHAELMALAQELNLEIEDFRPLENNLERYCIQIGGHRYFERDLCASFAPLAQKIKADLAKIYPNASSTSLGAPDPTYLNQFDRLTLRAYLDCQTDLDAWFKECIAIAYRAEYGLECHEQSAMNLLALIGLDTAAGFQIYGASDECFRLKGGNESLIQALQKKISGFVPIHLGHQLVRLKQGAHDQVLDFAVGGQSSTQAKSTLVICTLPFAALRNVEGLEQLGLSPDKLKCIREMGYGTNSKHMIGFSERLWATSSLGQGSAGFTGLTFCDLRAQSFWDTSRLQPGRRGILTNYIGGREGQFASQERLPEILKNLDSLYPGLESRYDQNQALFNPTKNSFFGGSYACLLPGQYSSFLKIAGTSELGGRLLFAGEHTSRGSQGYMNGGVESGQRAAEEVIVSLGLRAVA